MTPVAKLTVSLASLALLAGLTACAQTPQSAPATAEVPAPSPSPSASTFLEKTRSHPEYVPDGTLWLIYPDDLRCEGTEGCGNDFVSFYGYVPDPLPPFVEYYDPAKHNYNPETGTGMVFPAQQLDRDCDSPKMPPLGSIPIDQGAQKGATGEVDIVDGVPTSYTVADNDSLPAIGERFCIDYGTIGVMTDIERNRDIYPGDVLKLRL